MTSQPLVGWTGHPIVQLRALRVLGVPPTNDVQSINSTESVKPDVTVLWPERGCCDLWMDEPSRYFSD